MLNIREQNKYVWLVLTSLLVLLISTVDYGTGPTLEFGVVYLVPVLIGTTISKHFGLVVSLVSALLGVFTDFLLVRHDSNPLGYLWDFGSHMVIYSLAALLHSNLRQTRNHERELARTDALTGAMNGRAFYESVETEIYRAGRRNNPVTFVYIDVDNFKTINDGFGHSVGDELLRTIVTTIKRHIRMTDALARLGGDEFALLLPETNQDSARMMMTRIQSSLLGDMQQNNWPITFSIGVLICSNVSCNTDELVKRADELMYSVKRGSKNAIEYATYED